MNPEVGIVGIARDLRLAGDCERAFAVIGEQPRVPQAGFRCVDGGIQLPGLARIGELVDAHRDDLMPQIDDGLWPWEGISFVLLGDGATASKHRQEKKT